MNLVIDAGNTFIKFGIFEKDNLILSKKFLTNKPEQITQWVREYSIDHALIASVTNLHKQLFNLNSKKINVKTLSHKIKFPIKNLYKTPHTLGHDRIAAVTGAYSLYPKRNNLIIDAGTCITFDFINKKGEYMGGSISPGLEMRFKSLNNFTLKLPLIKKSQKFELTGKSTNESILSGVQNGIIEEIKGIIKNYESKYVRLNVLLTGGDAHFFENHLKKHIFVHPNLVLIGLNTILKYNLK